MLPEIEEISQGYRPYLEWPFCYEIYGGPPDFPNQKRKVDCVRLSKFDVYVEAYNYLNHICNSIESLMRGYQPKTEISTINSYNIFTTNFYMAIHKQPKLKLNKIYKLMGGTIHCEPHTYYVRKVHCERYEDSNELDYISSIIPDQYKHWLSN